MSAPYFEEGRYRGEIVAQALGQARTGTPQIVLRFKVLEFENGTPVQNQYERTIYRALTVNTMPYVIEDLKTLGYTRDSFRFIDPVDPNHHSFIGQEFVAFCQHKAGQDGGLREQWGIAKDGGGKLEVEPLESKKLRELDNLFGKQLRSELGQGKTTAVAPPRRSPAPEIPPPSDGITDDDCPF